MLGKRSSSSEEFIRALFALLRDCLEFLLLDVKVQPCHTAGVLGLKKETIVMI